MTESYCTFDETETWECVCDNIWRYGEHEPMHFVRERTCHDTAHFDGCFACSACGEELEDPRQEPNFVRWCPFCGAKVVDE